jgi:5-methylcytosine-specific restriction enzyme subunit McrC
LEQGYHEQTEEVASLRGRIDAAQSGRRFLPVHGRAICHFDELGPNTLANRIIRATLKVLASSVDDRELRRRVKDLWKRLSLIDDMPLSWLQFRKVQLSANTSYYGFLLHVCQLVFKCSVLDQASGEYRFRDFLRDEREMARVFEEFLFNFLRMEARGWQVRREQLRWRASSGSDPSLSLLPRMQTDISLRKRGQYRILDAKFYPKAFSSRYGAEKIRSSHLYQLLSYLANAAVLPGEVLSGTLVYPKVDREIRERYVINGFDVEIRSIDLAADWSDLREQALSLVGCSVAPPVG